MELSKITDWLASAQDFTQGVALYQTSGPNKVYQRLFDLGATDYSRQVLVRELRSLVGQVPEEIAALKPLLPPEAPLSVLVVPVPTTPPASTTSPHLVGVRQQLRAVRDERSQLHAQLTAKNLGKIARYALADRILALTDQETTLKAHEAHVLEYGRLPGPVPTADVTDAGELRQRLTNLLSRRSKLKKQPARAEDLAGAEAEITLIRSKLNNDV